MQGMEGGREEDNVNHFAETRLFAGTESFDLRPSSDTGVKAKSAKPARKTSVKMSDPQVQGGIRWSTEAKWTESRLKDAIQQTQTSAAAGQLAELSSVSLEDCKHLIPSRKDALAILLSHFAISTNEIKTVKTFPKGDKILQCTAEELEAFGIAKSGADVILQIARLHKEEGLTKEALRAWPLATVLRLLQSIQGMDADFIVNFVIETLGFMDVLPINSSHLLSELKVLNQGKELEQDCLLKLTEAWMPNSSLYVWRTTNRLVATI